MVTLIKIVGAVVVGVFLGLLITIHALDDANATFTAGPWRSATRQGSGEIDPYALAANARSGVLALGASEGLSFIAETDSRGVALTGRCDYAVGGPVPGARFWTLSLLSTDGFPIANPASRFGFTSAEVLRMAEEPLLVSVAAEARAGNWLPSPRAGRFMLMLRLYDTGLSAVGTVLDASAMPTIRRIACL